jgi:peptide/nickel transport system substrate-binding protein
MYKSYGISRTIAILIAILVIIAVVGVAIYIAGLRPPAVTTTIVPAPTITATVTVATPTTIVSPVQTPTVTTPTPTITTPTPTITTPVTTPAPQYKLHTQVLYIISNDENTRIQLYKSGAVDIAVVTPARWKDLNGTKVGNFYLILQPDPNKPRLTIQHIIFNTMREPFNITEVRQALAYATPYSVILDQVFGGLYVPLYTIVPKGMFGYTEYGIIKYTYNLTKAREIINSLKAKGFDPTKYTITIIYNTGNTARAQIAALLQNAWSQLGFKVLVETYNWPQYLNKVDHFDFDVALLGWVPDYLDPDNYLTPFVWGGAEFKEINYYKDATTADVSKYLSKVERVIDTPKYIVVVGPKGSGASYTGATNKPLLIISYVLDEEATKKNWEKPYAMVTIGAPGWKDVPVSALVKLSKRVLDPEVREAIINAAVIVFNNEVPMIMLGQAITGLNYGSWVKNMYYPLTTFARYDLVYEDPNAPVVDTGVLGIKNDPETMVLAYIGWPDTFDTAKSYETFGWEIFQQIYSKLVDYEYENIEPEPQIAIAWAFNEAGDELYFVIRDGVVAYDPWNNKIYNITAVDVLFSIWRSARLNLDPSWLISDFIDVNASTVMSLDEFKQTLSKGLVTVYHGKEYKVNDLDSLLKVFGTSGVSINGVVKFKLYSPYAPILHIFTTGPASIISMQYALGDNYEKALKDSNYGRNPSAWASYVIPGEDDSTFKLLKDKPISTGPYYVASYKEDSYILLKINPYYWNSNIWLKLYGYKPKP